MTRARPGVTLALVDGRGRTVRSRRVDRLGALLFRGVRPGRGFPRFPLPGTIARSWYLGDIGQLTNSKPSIFGNDVFTWNKGARPATDFSGDAHATDPPARARRQRADGTAALPRAARRTVP